MCERIGQKRPPVATDTAISRALDNLCLAFCKHISHHHERHMMGGRPVRAGPAMSAEITLIDALILFVQSLRPGYNYVPPGESHSTKAGGDGMESPAQPAPGPCTPGKKKGKPTSGGVRD